VKYGLILVLVIVCVVAAPLAVGASPLGFSGPSGSDRPDVYDYDIDFGAETPPGFSIQTVSTGMVGILVPEVDSPPDYLPGDDTLPAVISSLFGVYTPRTQTVTAYLMDGTTITYTEPMPGLAGVDWAWLSGVATFGVVLCSAFSIIGSVIRRG
jgi:hypothetical protein